MDDASPFPPEIPSPGLKDVHDIAAASVFRDGEPQLLNFGTRLRFGCHGSIKRIFAGGTAASLRTARTAFHSKPHATAVSG